MENRTEYQLTAREASFIDRMRKEEIREQYKLFKEIAVLHTAYEFLVWLSNNEAELTFSTFTKDFGYKHEEYSTYSIFEAITAILNCLDKLL